MKRVSRDLLKQILMKHRGGWQKKLPADLRSELESIDQANLNRAAVIYLHGPARCVEGNQRPFKRIGEGWQFCGDGRACPCRMKNDEEKRVATSRAKWGVDNPAQAAEVKAKIASTSMERYGVASTASDPARRERAKATIRSRFGVDNPFQAEHVRAAARDRMRLDTTQQHLRARRIEKLGVDNPMSLLPVRAKVAATNEKRYGGRTPAASNIVREKMKASMDARFGGHVAHQHILPEHRIMGRDDFAARFGGRKAKDMAEVTGYHPTMIHRYARMWDVPLDYSGGNKREQEAAFGKALAAFGLPMEQNVRCLSPSSSDDARLRQEVDFLFRGQAIGIEFCGVYWHSTANGRSKAYHSQKRMLAAQAGLSLIQVFADEWEDRPEAVLSAIRHRLGVADRQRVMARQCEVVEVRHTEAAAFLDQNHVFGSGTGATLHLGLRTRPGDLVALMSLTLRDKASRRWEMVRYATSCTVAGGASKLLAAFERSQDWNSITSMIDLRWSEGSLYERIGFLRDVTYPPDYAYVIAERRVHKFNLRKSSKRFAHLDPSLTESQMAESVGLPRIYDAGRVRVVKRRS